MMLVDSIVWVCLFRHVNDNQVLNLVIMNGLTTSHTESEENGIIFHFLVYRRRGLHKEGRQYNGVLSPAGRAIGGARVRGNW